MLNNPKKGLTRTELLRHTVRLGKALLAASGLVLLQLAGDALVAKTGWPIPGALVGLLLLLGGLSLRGHVPQALDDVSTPLLRHLMLLLIPSVAAVGLYVHQLAQQAWVFALVSTVVTGLTVAVTALGLQAMMKKAPQ